MLSGNWASTDPCIGDCAWATGGGGATARHAIAASSGKRKRRMAPHSLHLPVSPTEVPPISLTIHQLAVGLDSVAAIHRSLKRASSRKALCGMRPSVGKARFSTGYSWMATRPPYSVPEPRARCSAASRFNGLACIIYRDSRALPPRCQEAWADENPEKVQYLRVVAGVALPQWARPEASAPLSTHPG